MTTEFPHLGQLARPRNGIGDLWKHLTQATDTIRAARDTATAPGRMADAADEAAGAIRDVADESKLLAQEVRDTIAVTKTGLTWTGIIGGTVAGIYLLSRLAESKPRT
jgi:hypothetical protein